MRRGLLFIGVALAAGACSLPWSDPAPIDHDSRYVALTPDVVAQAWAGHTSGAVFTFAKDGTVRAEGVATATFDTAGPFAKDAPHGPYTCLGTWTIGADGHELAVRFERIADAAGREPFGGPRTLKFQGMSLDEHPQWSVVLYRYEDWLAPQ